MKDYLIKVLLNEDLELKKSLLIITSILNENLIMRMMITLTDHNIDVDERTRRELNASPPRKLYLIYLLNLAYHKRPSNN